MEKFRTLEELKEKYPIDTKLNIRKSIKYDIIPYYNETDLEIYKKQYEIVEIRDNNTILIKIRDIEYDTVEGYLFDGKYWYPVQNTWDGWMEIEERPNV